LLRQPVDPRLGGVDALAQQVEVLRPDRCRTARGVDHDLAVEHARLVERELEFREVAPQRPRGARLPGDVVAVHEPQATKAVPLGLVGPLLALRQRDPRQGELGLERRFEGEGQGGYFTVNVLVTGALLVCPTVSVSVTRYRPRLSALRPIVKRPAPAAT